MSFVRRHVIKALQRRKDVRVCLSGQGWPDYDERLPLRDNIARLMPEADAVFAYKPLGSREVPPLIDVRERNGIPLVQSFNECWWPDYRALRECQNSGTDLAILHHQNDAVHFGGSDAPPGSRPLLVHIPHCAEPRLFLPHARPWMERDIPILVTGALNDDIYPLRTRAAKLIQQGKLPGMVRRHPGYRLRSLEDCRRQEVEYAKLLGRTKLVVCCSSKYRYFLAKYVEAAAAGCVIAGDRPDDGAFEPLAGWMIELRPDASDTELVSALTNALNDYTLPVFGAGLQQEFAGDFGHRSGYTTDHYAEKFLAAVNSLFA